MSTPKPQAMGTPWGRLWTSVPNGSASTLVVGPGDEITVANAERWNPSVGEVRPDGSFEVVVCAETIQADPHPANLLLALWEAMPLGGQLFLHSRVLTDPKQSAYARFDATAAGKGAWVPGRLALRWTIETNGFDFKRWLDAGATEPRGEADAYLIAVRTARTPALVLATPVPVDSPSPKGDVS